MASSTARATDVQEDLAEGFVALLPMIEAMTADCDSSRKQAIKSRKAYETASESDKKAAAENFKALALEHKEKESTLKDGIEMVAAKLNVDPKKVVTDLKTCLEVKSSEHIMKIFKSAQTIDICFVIDGTGSMQPYIDGVRKQVRRIIAELQGCMKYLQFQLGAVIYRDVGDGQKRFEVSEFDGSITKFETFMAGIKPFGGQDQCEDVVGGLAKASQMKWSYASKVLILCGDAPCHGREYHEGCDDHYPAGSFEGSLDPAEVISALKQKSTDLTFLRINSSTDRMIKRFDEVAGGNWITTCALDGSSPEALGKSIRESVKASLTGSLSRSGVSARAAAEKAKERTFAATTEKLSKIFEEGPATSGT